MYSILAEYALPVIALIVSIVTLILVTKQELKFRKMIENDKEFMKWREKHRSNKKIIKKISKLERVLLIYQKKMEILMGVTIKKCDVFISPNPNRTYNTKLQSYYEKMKLIEQRIECLRGDIK